MPKMTKREWNLIYHACHQLWEVLDITNGDIKERLPDIFKENKKDMKILSRIMEKINRMRSKK